MREMKENKEKLREAIAHVEEAHKILVDLFEQTEEEKEEPKDNKVKVTIKVQNPYDGIEINDEELEQIRKDLEEIINDFTRE